MLHDEEYIDAVKQEIYNTISQYKCNEKTSVGNREFMIDKHMFIEMFKVNISGQNIAL